MVKNEMMHPENEATKSRRGWLAILLGVIFSLGAIALVFREVNGSEVWEQVRQADERYLIAMLSMYPIAMTVRAYRWRLLLHSRLAYWRGFHIINVGYFLNAVLPFRIGEFARILLVSREPEQNIGAGLSAGTGERLFDLLMALFFF